MRATNSGYTADFVRESELVEPGLASPFTNIAWRLWDLAVDCFGYYNGKAFNSPGTDLIDQAFVGSAAEAVPRAGRNHRPFP